jgi:hypothetical protein
MHKLKLIFCSAFIGCCANIHAQKRLLLGGITGISTAYILSKENENVYKSSGTPYAGLQLEYQLTSLFSVNGQLHYQSEKYNNLVTGTAAFKDVRLTVKRLYTGFTEYRPIGNHAAYFNLGLTLTHYNATGIETGTTNAVNLFKKDGFNPLQFGFGLQLGYVFRFGLSLQSGFMNDFTQLYKVENTRLNRQQFQILQIGFMPGFKKRDNVDTWNRKKRKRNNTP